MEVKALAQIFKPNSYFKYDRYTLWEFSLRRNLNGESYWTRMSRFQLPCRHGARLMNRSKRYTDKYVRRLNPIYLGMFDESSLVWQDFVDPTGYYQRAAIKFEESHLCQSKPSCK